MLIRLYHRGGHPDTAAPFELMSDSLAAMEYYDAPFLAAIPRRLWAGSAAVCSDQMATYDVWHLQHVLICRWQFARAR